MVNWYLFFFFTTGSRILNVEVPKDQMYTAKFKGIAVCFSLLKVLFSSRLIKVFISKMVVRLFH